MIEKRTPDLLTPSTIFYDVLVSCNRFSKAEMRQFGAAGSYGLKRKNWPTAVIQVGWFFCGGRFRRSALMMTPVTSATAPATTSVPVTQLRPSTVLCADSKFWQKLRKFRAVGNLKQIAAFAKLGKYSWFVQGQRRILWSVGKFADFPRNFEIFV